jgi:hypothetical protein
MDFRFFFPSKQGLDSGKGLVDFNVLKSRVISAKERANELDIVYRASGFYIKTPEYAKRVCKERLEALDDIYKRLSNIFEGHILNRNVPDLINHSNINGLLYDLIASSLGPYEDIIKWQQGVECLQYDSSLSGLFFSLYNAPAGFIIAFEKFCLSLPVSADQCIKALASGESAIDAIPFCNTLSNLYSTTTEIKVSCKALGWAYLVFANDIRCRIKKLSSEGVDSTAQGNNIYSFCIASTEDAERICRDKLSFLDVIISELACSAEEMKVLTQIDSYSDEKQVDVVHKAAENYLRPYLKLLIWVRDFSCLEHSPRFNYLFSLLRDAPKAAIKICEHFYLGLYNKFHQHIKNVSVGLAQAEASWQIEIGGINIEAIEEELTRLSRLDNFVAGHGVPNSKRNLFSKALDSNSVTEKAAQNHDYEENLGKSSQLLTGPRTDLVAKTPWQKWRDKFHTSGNLPLDVNNTNNSQVTHGDPVPARRFTAPQDHHYIKNLGRSSRPTAVSNPDSSPHTPLQPDIFQFENIPIDVDTEEYTRGTNSDPITVSRSDGIAQTFSIPRPVPKKEKELQLDFAKISVIEAESHRVTSMLNTIFDESAESSATPPPPISAVETLDSAGCWGLDSEFSAFLRLLGSRPAWSRAELEELAADRSLMLDGVLEHINEAALDRFDQPFTEGDDPLEINQALIKEINS